MAEEPPREAPGSVDPPLPSPPTAITTVAISAASIPATSTYPTENPSNNIASVSNTGYSGPGLGLAPKRHRRPSVRLGEIGDQSFDQLRSQSRRSKAGCRFHKDPSLAAKSSKTRPITNLVKRAAGEAFNLHENQEEDNSFAYEFGSKRPITKKPTKRARTIWVSSAFKLEAAASNGGGVNEFDSSFRGENHETDEFRDLEAEVSDRQMKEQSPVHSNDNQNMGLHFWDHRATTRTLGSRSEGSDRHENIHNNTNNRNNAVNGIHDTNSVDDNRVNNGVRDWLISLGLGRYAPVFELHEVDDQVLPMLTLEDLKDMGINAVGSRRKMFAGILKLREGFS